jgi:hypothetical protein
MTMWLSMYAIEKAQRQTQGRHSGWATISDCRTAANATYAENGLPTLTTSEIQDLIEGFLQQGLLHTKHCDTDSGVQQYVKVSSDYEDFKAYVARETIFKDLREGAEDGSAKKWWTRDDKGNYHPNGPSSAIRERYKPIIEIFWKGLRVKERGIRSPGEQDRM